MDLPQPLPQSNLLPTPDAYANPQQVQQAIMLAQALSQKQQNPVTNPWEGVSNLVRSLTGGATSAHAATLERGSRQSDVASLPAASQQPGGARNAISGIESGGKYDTLGPVTKTGDRAYGRYQVMGENVGPWTREVLGQEMTPKDFLANPKAQDAVFNAKFGQLTQKYGPSGAARAWFAGESGMNNPNARDQLGTTVAQYEQKFNRGMGAPGPVPAPGQPQTGAMQFQGAGQQEAPAQAAITSALTSARTATPKSPYQPGLQQPDPNAANAHGPIQPGLTPLIPQVSRGQFENIMASSWLPSEVKQAVYGQYMQQNQPVRVPYTGGNVIVNRQGQEQYVPDLQKVPTEVGAGGATAKTDLYGVTQPLPNGGVNFNYLPQGGAPAAPPGPLPGIPPAPQSPSAAPQSPANDLSNLPNLLHYTGEGQPGQQPSQPPIPGQSPTQSPGQISGVSPGPPPPTPGLPGQQTAQAQIPGLPPQMGGMLQGIRDFGLDTTARQKAIEQNTTQYAKVYQDRNNAGTIAIRSIPSIQMALNLTKDPTFISGFFGGGRLDVAKAKAFLSDYAGTDPKAALATEMFQKLMSGNIVEDMKVMLGGLGQVRNAEIDLLSKATGNLYNTPVANQAVLQVMLRTHQLVGNLAQMATAYTQGVRWDPKTGQAYKDPNAIKGVLDPGWDQVQQQYMLHHPIFNDDEISHYQKILGEDKGAQPSPAAEKYGGVQGIKQQYETARGSEMQGGTQAPAASGLTPEDQSALDWANSNPTDPRAIQIKKLHGQ
jgi:hypothetical protein